jgi:hypothetical protein
LGKTVTPDENANYDLLRSEPVGGHCSYPDGCFWQEPSGEDQQLRFALAERGSANGRVSFTVYGVNLYNWPGFELDPLPGLSREEAETLVREGKLSRCFYGDALLERSETGLRLLEYAKQDLAPEPVTDPEPETNPVPDGPEPSYDLDPVRLNSLLTAFAEQGITTIDILHNNAFFWGDYALCGTRGWFYEEEKDGEHDGKIMRREIMRLEASLKAAGDRTKIVFLHYPPIYGNYRCEEILSLLKEHRVPLCYYGHIHGKGCAWAFNGYHDGTQFRLVSADFVNFTPVRIPFSFDF